MEHQLRIKALIDRCLRNIVLNETRDIVSFISINKIVINNDYSIAKVYVSFLNDENTQNVFIKFKKIVALEPQIRFKLSKEISLYKTPEIHFVLDNRFVINKKMNDLFKKINNKKV